MSERDEDGTPWAKPVKYDRIYGYRVGGIPLVFGRTEQDGTSGPVVFAAAFSERDLHHEQCGYGATESEAAADLLRQCRPPSIGL